MLLVFTLVSAIARKGRISHMPFSRENLPSIPSIDKPIWLSTWGVLIGYCAVIFYLSSRSDLVIPNILVGGDKMAHFLEYGVLGWLWGRAVRITWPAWPTLTVLLSTAAFVGAFGLSDEWHQLYVPRRNSDLSDVLADICGGMFSTSCFLLWRWLRNKAVLNAPEGREYPSGSVS